MRVLLPAGVIGAMVYGTGHGDGKFYPADKGLTTMREIHDHKVNPANDRLSIVVTDEPGAGGAHRA